MNEIGKGSRDQADRNKVMPRQAETAQPPEARTGFSADSSPKGAFSREAPIEKGFGKQVDGAPPSSDSGKNATEHGNKTNEARDQTKDLQKPVEAKETTEKLTKENYPKSFEEVKALLDREKIKLEKNGYVPSKTDAELKAQAAAGKPPEYERYMVRLQPVNSDQDCMGRYGEIPGKNRAYTCGLSDIYRADHDPELISKIQGMEFDKSKNYELVIIDSKAPPTDDEFLSPTFENVENLGNKHKIGEDMTPDLTKEERERLRSMVCTPEYNQKYSELMDEFKKKYPLRDSEYQTTNINKFISDRDHPNLFPTDEDKNMFILRHSHSKALGTNKYWTGDGMTKDLRPNRPDGNTRGSTEYLHLAKGDETDFQLDKLEKKEKVKRIKCDSNVSRS